MYRREGLKRIVVRFYRTDSGNEPVQKWLKGLTTEDRKEIGADLQTLEFGWPVGMPLCRSLSSHNGLWEVRCNLAGGRIASVLFCARKKELILLYGFIKKTQKTPEQAISIAVKRMKGEDHD
ncbi:MAG: type II toxin-antitoxin system RelE/ParE family toxin [Candidatus Brocadiaceae bacterium]|nr:type II toxin-antitoxin system RelE/ParE family toxin [Candidatus Brocadiaceae bacterium]